MFTFYMCLQFTLHVLLTIGVFKFDINSSQFRRIGADLLYIVYSI
jgi:hypothetical protein